MLKWIAGAALLAISAPAVGQGEWRHEGSGITLPGSVGDMRRGEQRDLANGFDVTTQYGTDQEPATLYVYRSSYPNPALWFERTRMAMNMNVGSGNADAAPRPFTLGGGATPNGLREEIDLPPGGRFRTTAVAIAQVGAWIVKARITSPGFDRAGIAARMDALLGAVRLQEPQGTPHPLQLPALCSDDVSRDGQPVRGDRETEVAAAAVIGLIEYAEAHGGGGLAAAPSAWCRETSSVPARLGAIYRARDGSAWVMLVGDSGMAITGRTFAPIAQGAAAFASTPASTRVVEVYERLPDPAATIDAAAPVLMGQSPGLAEISVGSEPPRP